MFIHPSLDVWMLFLDPMADGRPKLMKLFPLEKHEASARSSRAIILRKAREAGHQPVFAVRARVKDLKQ